MRCSTTLARDLAICAHGSKRAVWYFPKPCLAWNLQVATPWTWKIPHVQNYSFCMLSTRIVKHHPMGTIDKRDKNDSAKIADFLYRYDGTECAKPYKLPSKAMQQLKQLVNERKFLVEQRTNFMNRMQMFETKEDSAMYESYIKSSIMTLRR